MASKAMHTNGDNGVITPESPEIEDGEETEENENSKLKNQFELIDNELQHLFSLGLNNRGQGMMKRGVDMAVGILVVGLLTAYLLPIAISELTGVDTSSWGSAESQLFNLLPIFFVLAILLFVVNKAT